MKKTLTILASQLNFTVGAIEDNAKIIKSVILNHQANHDLILFPELSLTGYPPEDLLFRESLHYRVEKALKMIATITQDCHVVVGHPIFENNQLFNAASIFYQGCCIQQYCKQKLPNQGVFDEKRYFTPGPETPCLLTINNYSIGLCICEDLWQKGPAERLIKAGCEVLVCINASPYDYKKHPQRIALLERYAKQGLTVVYVNLVGGQDDLVFDGQSFALDQNGKRCAQLPAFIEANETITLSKGLLQGPITQPQSQEAEIYNALVLGTHDYVKKHGFPGVLLGLSGGVDSALTLAIAVDALGAEHVHALIMPSRFTAPMSIDDAQQQAKIMGVKTTVLSIEPTFEAMLNTLSESFKVLPANITEHHSTISANMSEELRMNNPSSALRAPSPRAGEEGVKKETLWKENMQARIRGMLLMAFSNKTGDMVLTTSNKSESAVGYATLYGDMAGGFAVLKDVLKTQVYPLAYYRNSVAAVIPERVLTRAPSAELAENQTDQDSLPPYSILDAIIKAYVENTEDADWIISQGFSEEVVHKVIKLIKQNEYKRRQAAPGPKISPRAFSRDPITSKY